MLAIFGFKYFVLKNWQITYLVSKRFVIALFTLTSLLLQVLYEAGEGRWGTDESEFNRILCLQSHAQLAVTFQEYTKLSKKNIEQVIQSEFSGNVEQGMLAIGERMEMREIGL